MKGHTAEDVAIVRQLAPTTPDHIIGERLGYSARKIAYIRQWNGIPAASRARWPEEKIQQVYELYIVQGLPSAVVGEKVGESDSAIRALKERRKWVRDPTIAARNTQAENERRGHTGAAPKAKRAVAPKAETKPKRDASKAPINFSSAPKVVLPLDRRIMDALAARPLSAPTLAVIIGEKELSVASQLAAMAHAGAVTAFAGEGRHRKWGIAA